MYDNVGNTIISCDQYDSIYDITTNVFINYTCIVKNM